MYSGDEVYDDDVTSGPVEGYPYTVITADGTTRGRLIDDDVLQTIAVGAIGSMRDDPSIPTLCPRCRIDLMPVGYHGALSRADNATEVCSPCGVDEAFVNWSGRPAQPPAEWPVARITHLKGDPR